MRRSVLGVLVLALLLGVASPAFAVGNCTVFSSFTDGQLLTAADLNANLVQSATTNSTLFCLDDLSTNAAQAASTRDPYPAGVESLATSAAEELQGLRYVLGKVTGYSAWYKHTERLAIPNTNWTQGGDMEDFSAGVAAAPDGWTLTGAAATVAREATIVKHATYAAKVTRVGTNAYLGQRVEALSRFGPVAWWQSKTVTLGAWVYATAATTTRIGLNDDGVDGNTTWSAYHAGSSAWVFLTVSKTLGAGATRVEPRLAVDTTNTSSYFDGVILAIGQTVTDFIPSSGTGASSAGSGAASVRGLFIETENAETVSPKEVFLLSADEIVMDDGTRTTAWANLSADINTPAAAGGRDTSDALEVAWYELYAIRNSGTDARALLFHKARDFFQDETYTTSDNIGYRLRRNTGAFQTKLAQGFKVDTTAKPAWVELKLEKLGTPTGRYWVTIEADNAGVPFGAPDASQVLATSEKMIVSDMSTARFVRLYFTSATTLTATTQYHLVLQADYAASDTNNLTWRADNTAPTYGNGSHAACNTGSGTCTSYTSDTGVDMLFTLAMDRSSAVVLPSGFDQKALISYAYNTSAAVAFLQTYEQRDRAIRLYNPVVVLSGGAATLRTDVDTSATVPALATAGLYRLNMAASDADSAAGFTVTIEPRFARGAYVGRTHTTAGGASSTASKGSDQIVLHNRGQHFYYFTTADGGGGTVTIATEGFTF